MKDLKRRAFLRQVLNGAMGSALLSYLPNVSFAQNSSKKFLLRIHMGSWCGWSSGLLQPRDVGDYPTGCFFKGQDVGALNPNLNKHFKTGNLVFNDYSKCLERISDHLCFAVGNSRSVSHDVARLYQNTGDRKVGANANPAWAVGVAQASKENRDVTFVVKGNGGRELIQTGRTTPNVATLNAETMTEVKENFSDDALIRDIQNKEVFTQLNSDNILSFSSETSPLSSSAKGPLNNSMKSVSRGIENIDSLQQEISSAISLEKVLELTNAMDDNLYDDDNNPEEGVSERLESQYTDLIEQLQTAALLIEGDIASGMSISLDGQDFHRGNAESITARSGGCVWAAITRFWEWVVSKGYQDQVMICASHEFSRTPYNGSRQAKQTIYFKNDDGQATSVEIENPGRDHHISFGMVFINGKVPAKGRIGGIADGYVPAGSEGPDGVVKSDIPAYSSTQLVGSMFMRCWSDIFPNYRAVRDIFPNFVENQQIGWLLK